MSIPLKLRVKADVDAYFEKVRGTGSWLNKGLSFNHSLRLKNNQKEKLDIILAKCGVPKRKENYRNLDILIANLLRKRDIRPVVISLNNNDWKLTRYNRAGKTILKLIHELEENGYIELKKGYSGVQESRLARIWTTDKLLDCFPDYKSAVIYDPVEVVILRDDKKKPKEYKDTARTRKIRAILKRANKVNESADIKHKKYALHTSLIAVFNMKFTLNGRVHSKGYRHYQGLSSDERKQIKINGDSVVELDYSGLHPHLLYAKEGIQLNIDPYSIVNNRPEARLFLKIILICMINSKDELTAEKAANDWLRNYNERKELYNIGITRARPLMVKIRKSHKPIEHYFCNGNKTGLKIMNLDSRIALDIIDHFAKQDIPILAIHDSFIVQSKYKDELLHVMESTYEKHTKGFKCKIK